MADEPVKFKGTCKRNKEHLNEYDECVNCGNKKLHLQRNEEEKIIIVSCKACHHSITSIKCKTCSTMIYWQDFSTKEIEEAREKAKQKKKDQDFLDFVMLFILALVVLWLYTSVF